MSLKKLVLPLLLSAIAASAQSQITFSSGNTVPTNGIPFAVSIQDLNGDGNLDIAAANVQGSNVNTLLGSGGGDFAAAINVDAGIQQPVAISNADFNADGIPDVVVLSPIDSVSGMSEVSVLLGNGDGSFQAPKKMTGSALRMAAGDFNGDGKVDLVVAAQGADAGTSVVSTLLGNGDGTFQNAVQQASVPDGIIGALAVGDLNGDGRIDVAAPGASGEITLLLSNGDGTFKTVPGPSVASGYYINSLAVGPPDSDGNAALIVMSYQLTTSGNEGPRSLSTTLSMFSGQGNNTFSAEKVLTTSQWAKSSVFSSAVGDLIVQPVLADFDGDNIADVAVTRQALPSNSASIEIYSTQTGSLATTVQLTGEKILLGAGDLNGDTLGDLVLHDVAATSLFIEFNTTPMFTLSLNPSTAPTIKAGSSASLTLSVGSANGFSGTVDVTCVPPASVGISCSATPASLAPGGTAQITVSTTGTVARALSRAQVFLAFCSPLFGLCMFGICLPNRRRQRVGVLLLSCSMLCLLLSCGDSNKRMTVQGTPAGTYQITIGVTSGAIHRSLNLRLSVR